MINYERIRAYMLLTNWKWGNNVPSIEKMKEVVTRLKEDCKNGSISSMTGGFKVHKHKDETGHYIYTTEFILDFEESE